MSLDLNVEEDMLPSVQQLFLFTLKSLERNMLQWMGLLLGIIAIFCN